MNEERSRYVSYLLRLWQTQDGEALIWRASLESAHSEERRGFASLAELYAFLEQETASPGTVEGGKKRPSGEPFAGETETDTPNSG